MEKIKQNIPSGFNSGFVVAFLPQLHVQLLIQILEEDYLYEVLKMEGALKGITILLPEARFIASKLQVLASSKQVNSKLVAS